MSPGGRGQSELLSRRLAAMGTAYRLFYEQPLELARGEGVWLYDASGAAYLDAYNNVPVVGHCHPRVVEAVSRQLGTLNTHTRYLEESVVACAERLLGRLAAPLNRIMFTCSGTEAVELALRVARAHTGGTGLIVTAHAYHGNSSQVARISPEEPAPEPPGPQVATIPAPDSYRMPKDAGADAGQYHLQCLADAIGELQRRGIQPAALIVDTIFSSEGIIRPPNGYLERAAAMIRAAGGLFIADEVQAGFGRLGEAFWGHEWQGVVPDIVTMGKPMGNGYPVAAMATQAEILESFARRAAYFNTFGGSQAACAATMAVLDTIEEQDLQHNARKVGAHLAAGLDALAGSNPLIGQVRGAGLYLGIDLVEDRDSRTPATRAARAVHNGLRERGVLIGVTGPHANVLKLRPPLVFTRDNADCLLERLEDCLRSIRAAG